MSSQTSVVQSFGAFSFNIFATVLIVTINRDLLTTRDFSFPCTLSGLHFITTYAYSRLSTKFDAAAAAAACSITETAHPSAVPKICNFDLLWFTVVGFLSISSVTVSLDVNTLGVYQVAKLASIGVTGLLEHMLMSKTFSRLTVASICIVLFGVGSTISDPGSEHSLFGLLAALVSWSISCQQIGIGLLQKRYSLSSAELISQTFGLQASVLLTLGPLLDRLLFGAYPWSWVGFHALGVVSPTDRLSLLASCLCAIMVNYSQVSCIKHLSPVGFQVLGNAKTIAILFVSWALFDGRVSRQTIGGQTVAVLGMVLYGWSVTQSKPCKAEAVEFAPQGAIPTIERSADESL